MRFCKLKSPHMGGLWWEFFKIFQQQLLAKILIKKNLKTKTVLCLNGFYFNDQRTTLLRNYHKRISLYFNMNCVALSVEFNVKIRHHSFIHSYIHLFLHSLIVHTHMQILHLENMNASFFLYNKKYTKFAFSPAPKFLKTFFTIS